VNEIRVNSADQGQAIAPLGANGFNIPSLLSLSETAPYFYSGLAQTLSQVFDGSQDGNGGTRHHFITDPAQRAALVSYLNSISAPGTCSIACPANITQGTDPNQCNAVVNYPTPTVDPSCGTLTCTPASGSTFPLGTTTVMCTTQAGPACSFTVTVKDMQPPTITCPADINSQSPIVTYPTPTASDNCGSVMVVCSPPSGSTFPVGTTTVNCTATDTAGNTASCSFNVTFSPGSPWFYPRKKKP